jgi:hypothetical protein
MWCPTSRLGKKSLIITSNGGEKHFQSKIYMMESADWSCVEKIIDFLPSIIYVFDWNV